MDKTPRLDTGGDGGTFLLGDHPHPTPAVAKACWGDDIIPASTTFCALTISEPMERDGFVIAGVLLEDCAEELFNKQGAVKVTWGYTTHVMVHTGDPGFKEGMLLMSSMELTVSDTSVIKGLGPKSQSSSLPSSLRSSGWLNISPSDRVSCRS